MVKREHYCVKEKELAILQTDSEWVKQELIAATKKIDKMIDILTKGEGKISRLNKSVYGNGDKENSLSHKVKSNSDYILSQKAQMALIKGMIVILSTSNLYFIIKLLIGGKF